MKSFLRALFFIALSLRGDYALSQQYLFETQVITTDDGLANLMTNSVYKDSKGFIWIGTKYGLNRYDGYTFDLYTAEENDLYNNNLISRIQEDELGNLWLFFQQMIMLEPRESLLNAIDIFNPKTKKAVSFDDYFGDSAPFKATDVNPLIKQDPKNRLWIATKQGQVYLYEQGTFKKIFEKKGAFFQYLTVDDQEHIWLGWQNQLICIDSSGKLLETTPLPNQIFGIWTGENNKIWLSCVDKNTDKELNDISSIWSKAMGSNHLEPFVLHREGHSFELIKPNFPLIHRDQRGYWYINKNGYLDLFNEQGEWIRNFQSILGENIKTDFINFFDDGHYFWGASPLGLIKVAVKTNPFNYIYKRKEHSDCRGIIEDETGNIYFLDDYIYKWDPKSRKTKKTKAQGTMALVYSDSMLWRSLHSTKFLGVHTDLKTNEEVYYPTLNGDVAYAFLETQTPNQFLLGSNKGIVILDLNQQKILPFENDNSNDQTSSLLKESRVYYFHKNRSGIWLATENGIFLMREDVGIIRHFDKAKGDLPFDHIRHIYEDEAGVFWLATAGGGIIQWWPAKDKQNLSKSQQFTTKDGMSNNFIYAIYCDEYENLWIPSDKGLMQVNKKTLQTKTYLIKDGLSHNEFNLTSHYQATDGTLYFGGLGGLIALNPKEFSKDFVTQTPLKFTNYFLLEGDKEEMTDKTALFQETDEIIIKPNDKLFELRFALLDFTDPELHRYAYKIEGYTKSWTHIQENHIRINNLPHGTYTLKIKGKNNSSGWSAKELALKITVLKPFYLSWWFITGMAVSAVSVIIGSMKWRVAKLKNDRERLEKEVQSRIRQIEHDKQIITEQAKALQKLDKAKTRFFSNITHEFRTPLTLIMGPLEQILVEDPAPVLRSRLSGILKNARSLHSLINQLLDLSKLEGNQMKIEVVYGDIVNYTQELTSRFKSVANKKKQELHFNTDQDIWKTNFDKNKWQKIIYNLLSNAIKYSPEKAVINLNLAKIEEDGQDKIQLQVKDNGIGVDEKSLKWIFDRFYQIDDSSTRNQEGTGIGLALVKELVELQGGQISASSQLGEGSTFVVVLPILSDIAIARSFIPSSTEVVPIPIVVEKAAIVQAPKKEKLKLLLIEDNEEMRDYIRQCISSLGYHISETGNGEEGIEMALRIIPDLIISDVMMPKKNGFEVVQTVRNNTCTSHIPVILLTAKASLESRLEGFKRGADAYLSKPFSPQELVLRIQKLIEIRQLLLQRYSGNASIEGLSNKSTFKKEDEFIAELKGFIYGNINKHNLNGEVIGQHFALSRMQLHRKLKALTNKTTSQFIRSIRLETALQLIHQGQLNISEIAYQTGFSSPGHFSRIFKKQYGKAPSDL